jgi:hypothetical protein
VLKLWTSSAGAAGAPIVEEQHSPSALLLIVPSGRLALGRHADLVSELEAAVAEQPVREHLHAGADHGGAPPTPGRPGPRVCAVAWQAQQRLNCQWMRLTERRGKHAT